MNFPDLSAIPQGVKAAVQVAIGVALCYQYFKNRKKKVEVDPEYIEYSTAIGMGSFALMLISLVVIVVIYGADKDGISQAMNSILWILMILLVVGFSFVEYRFRKKKKRLATQAETPKQE